VIGRRFEAELGDGLASTLAPAPDEVHHATGILELGEREVVPVVGGAPVAGGLAEARRSAIGMCFDRTFPAGEVSAYAQAVEAAGATQLWIIEDCFFTAGVSLAATALAGTQGRCTLGIGILPAVARNPAITAMEIATLANIAPGRLLPASATVSSRGWSRWGRAPSPLTTLDETITVVKRLLAGEEVTFDGREVHLDQVRLDQPPAIVPPVFAGVQQEKSLALAGRVADGVILVEGWAPPT
jgi:5,10-methylenetetrahydromethanopterin reductase